MGTDEAIWETNIIMSLTVVGSKCRCSWDYLLSFLSLPRKEYHEPQWPGRHLFHPHLSFWTVKWTLLLRFFCSCTVEIKLWFVIKIKGRILSSKKHVRDWHSFHICKFRGLAEGDQEHRQEQVRESSSKELIIDYRYILVWSVIVSLPWLHYCCVLILEMSWEETCTEVIYSVPGLYLLQSVREQYLRALLSCLIRGSSPFPS